MHYKKISNVRGLKTVKHTYVRRLTVKHIRQIQSGQTQPTVFDGTVKHNNVCVGFSETVKLPAGDASHDVCC